MANNIPIIEHPEIRTMRKDIKRLKGLGKRPEKLARPAVMPEIQKLTVTPPRPQSPQPPPIKISPVQAPKLQTPPPPPPVQKTPPPPSSSKIEGLEDVKRRILENTQQTQGGTAKPTQETQKLTPEVPKLENTSSTTVKSDLFTITPKKEAQPDLPAQAGKPVPPPLPTPPQQGPPAPPPPVKEEPKPAPPSHPGKEKIFLKGISSAAKEHLKSVAKTEEEKRKRFMEDVESWASSKDEGEQKPKPQI